VFLQQEGVLAHQRVAHNPEEDPQPGQRSRVRDDRGERCAGHQEGLGQSADEADQADPDPQADQETTSAHPAPREVEATQEDEDPAEISREAEDDQGHDEEEEAEIV